MQTRIQSTVGNIQDRIIQYRPRELKYSNWGDLIQLETAIVRVLIQQAYNF
jgi:hypothetical protein